MTVLSKSAFQYSHKTYLLIKWLLIFDFLLLIIALIDFLIVISESEKDKKNKTSDLISIISLTVWLYQIANNFQSIGRFQ